MKIPKQMRILASALGLAALVSQTPEAQAQFINNRVSISNSAGYEVHWDQNNGRYFNAPAPTNAALAGNGGVAFASSDGASAGHTTAEVNDGIYGNANSWISANLANGSSDLNPWVAVRFPSAILVERIAWGRDNGNLPEGQFLDRSVGVYTIQITRVPSPNNSTPSTGNAATGWQTVAGIQYHTGAEDDTFTSYLRHEFNLKETGQSAIATAVRIGVFSSSGIGLCIDELEVNPPKVDANIAITPAAGFGLTWDGNEGDHFNSATAAAPPANPALASSGGVAIGTSQLGFGIHFITSINDGRYGNAFSWISANGFGSKQDANPWIGVRLPGLTSVRKIAWGRDNGNDSEGTYKDRTPGNYTVQFTRVATPSTATPETGNPTTGWQSIGAVRYLPGAESENFVPHLRHEFAVSNLGQPVSATGIRIKVSDGTIAIDELEVISNTAPTANAGPDQNLIASANCEAQAALSGAASTDPDGDTLIYTWRQNGVVIPSLGASANVTLSPGTHQFALTVDDGKGGSSSDTVSINVEAGVPTLTALSPADAIANGPDLQLTLSGSCFGSGAVIHWNGVTISTTFNGAGSLIATIPSQELVSAADLRLITVTVENPSGGISNPLVFAIKNASMGNVQSGAALAGGSATVSTAPTAAGQAGLTATAQNNGGDPLLISGGTYTGTPPSGLIFDAGGIYYDVQISGADASDSANVNFYYPSTFTGSTENKLKLTYFNGGTWKPVKASGNTNPSKNTTDNLDATISGGRFTALLDNTSTPKLTELTGTIFALANTQPLVSLTGSASPIHVNTSVDLNIAYKAIGTPESQTIAVDWGDGTVATPDGAASGNISLAHTFVISGEYHAAVTVTDVNGDVGSAELIFAITNLKPIVSITPVANSCDDIEFIPLNGAVNDPDGDTVGQYTWTQIAGPPVDLYNGNTLHAHFTPPFVPPGQISVTVTFELTSKEIRSSADIEALTGSATVNVLIKHSNRAPIADAGPAQNAPEGSVVTLDGSGSFDPDNDQIAAYAWVQTSGAIVQLTGADSAHPSFVAPNVGPTGATVRFELVVTDNPDDEFCGTSLASQAQSVEINIQYVNHSPVAVGSDPVNANEGSAVNLHASATDEDGNPLTWNWTQLSGPAVTLDLLDPANPVFVAPLVACNGVSLSFKAVVSDGFGGSAETTLIANIINVNNAPVADAGVNQSVPEGTGVTLSADASVDLDGEALSFAWVQVGGPSVILSGANSATLNFTAPIVTAGGDPTASETLTFVLTVTDTCGGSSTDLVEVKAANINHAPIAHAGGSQSRCEADMVTLSAAGSSDPDGDGLNYAWTQIAGPAVTLSGANSASPTFRAPFVGTAGATLYFEVTVTDATGASSVDTATVAVINCNTPPDCSKARASETVLWPPNHALVPISILGVQDPDSNVSITITSVKQDEAVNGTGDGDTGPDAVIRGNTVLLRAERAGNSNGRVYYIHFTATDGEGSCSGVVTVGVPHNKKADPIIGNGQLFNSTQ